MYLFTILFAIFYWIIYGNWIGGCLVTSLFLVLFFSIYFSKKDGNVMKFSFKEGTQIFVEGEKAEFFGNFSGKTFYNQREAELVYFVKAGPRKKKKRCSVKFFVGSKASEEISLKLGMLACDFYEIEFKTLKWKDVTGVYTAKVELNACGSILVLPKRYPLEFMEEKLKKRTQGFFSDYDGIRSYRPGDRLSNIHWKIFAGKRELYVREYEEEKKTPQKIALTLHGVSPKRYSDYFSIFYSLSAFFIEHGISQEIYFGNRSYFLESMEQYEELFYFIFRESLEHVPELGKRKVIWIHLDSKYKTAEDALYDMEL